MAFAVNGTLITAYACRFIPNCRMGEGVGYLGLIYTIALAVSPGIGLAIYNKFGPQPAFYCAGIVILLSLGFVMLIKDDGAPKNVEKRRIKLSDLAAPSLFPLASFNGLFALCNSIITAFIILHAESRGINSPAIFFTVTAVAMIFIRPFAGKIGDSKGIAYALVPAFIIGGVGMLFVAYMNSFPMLIAAAILTAFASGAGQPSVQAECIRRMPESRRGVAISTYFIFADIFFGCGPLIGGAMADMKGYVFTFVICAVVLFAGLGLYFLYAYFDKRKKSETGA
jgi:MFS family permease